MAAFELHAEKRTVPVDSEIACMVFFFATEPSRVSKF